MDDAVLDDDVLAEVRCPALAFIGLEHALADRAVVFCRGRRTWLDGREHAHQVRAADDPDHLAVTQHRDALDPPAFHQMDDLAQVGVLIDADDVRAHDITHGAAMLAREVLRLGRCSRNQPKPPRGAALGTGFGPVQQIAFADDPDYPSVVVHHRHAADPVIEHALRRLCDRAVGVDGDDVAGHDIAGLHGFLHLIMSLSAGYPRSHRRSLTGTVPPGGRQSGILYTNYHRL